jgi:hypothetical protein
MKTLQLIHREIKEYNNNYWSQFLFWFCITFIQINAIGFYQILFANLNIVLRLIYIYGELVTCFMLYIPLNSASSVVIEAKNSYKLLTNLFINNNFINFHCKIKVYQ